MVDKVLEFIWEYKRLILPFSERSCGTKHFFKGKYDKLNFMNHMVFVTMPPLCCSSMKRVINNMQKNMCDHVRTKTFLTKTDGNPVSCSLLTLGVYDGEIM